MENDILLTGPLASGKTSVALYLAGRLSVLNYPMDRIKWYYRFKNGYDIAKGSKILRAEGFGALLSYSYPYFSITDIQHFLKEFKGGIIDFGGSQTYFSSPDLRAEAAKILKPYPNVVLLLPSAELDECKKVLSERIRGRYSSAQRDRATVESYIVENNKFVEHEFHFSLAKHVVYTNQKTIQEVGEEIIERTGIAQSATDGRKDLGAVQSSETFNYPDFA